jgi:hypothetical protein
MFTLNQFSRVVSANDILSASPKEYIKHLKPPNKKDKHGIPLSMYFNKKNYTIYLYTNFCVINESAVDMRFSSGESLNKIYRCRPLDRLNKVVGLSNKEHVVFSGRLTKKSFADLGIDPSQEDRFRRIAFPKKLDHYLYTTLKGKPQPSVWSKLILLGRYKLGNKERHYSYDLLIRPYQLKLDTSISKLI